MRSYSSTETSVVRQILAIVDKPRGLLFSYRRLIESPMGASNEKLLYEAIQRYDVDAVRHLIYHTGVDPNVNIRPFLHGKNLPETVLPLKEVLNKINSPPLSNGAIISLDKKHTLEQRLDMRQRGGTIMKLLLEKGAKVDKEDILLVLEGYRNLREKAPVWAGKQAETEDPNVEHLRLLMEGTGGKEAIYEVKELFRLWESEIDEEDQKGHRWQLDVKLRQKDVLDSLKFADLIVTVSDESVDASSSSTEDKIYAL